MDSQNSPAPQSQQPPQHHHQPPPPQHHQPPSQPQHHQPPQPQVMMMPPPLNSYTPQGQIPNANNTANASTTLMQQNPSFPFNSVVPKPLDAINPQYPDGTSPASGFRNDGFGSEPGRKKRGRPRKYSPDGGNNNTALALCASPVTPTPNPTVGHGDSGGQVSEEPSSKKSRGRPAGSGKKQLDALGSPGIGFTPHVIKVNAGEDIAAKIMEFSLQGPRTICMLSANGAISNVTIRQSTLPGGIVSYEGRFEIISLQGSFTLSEGHGSRGRMGSLSVSLAGPDGRVIGGVIAGMLVAASPVQLIVGSFITDGKKGKSGKSQAQPSNTVNFGVVPGASPPSGGGSSGSSDESGSSGPLDRVAGPYNNATQQPTQPMYASMGWSS